MKMSPHLFADGPSRDARFDVKQRWVQCENLPSDHPLHTVEFFHRKMNEEVDSLEASAQTLVDFPDADWELRMDLARQCADEARHALAFRRHVEQRGGRVGQFPVLNFQYRIITAQGDVVSRLVIQNRSFAAGGLDAIQYGIDLARERGEDDLAEFYEAQLANKISHVRFVNGWMHRAMEDEPRTILTMGAALNAAAKAFRIIMDSEGTMGVDYPAAVQARLEAGFTEEEIHAVQEKADSARRVSKRSAVRGPMT
jgi:uncharacterized ferritin-like protein (DUF455 family)